MFCVECGSELKDGAKFCTSCGTPVGKVPTAEPLQPTVSPTPPVAGAQQGTPQPEVAAQAAPATNQIPTTGQQATPGPMPTPTTQPPADFQQGEKKPFYATTAVRIIIGIVGILLVIMGIVKIVGAFAPSDTDGGNKPATYLSSSSGKDASSSTASSSTSASSTASSSAKTEKVYGNGASFTSWPPECLDSNGYPTVYAISELEGWQLETLMQKQGMTWNESAKQWEGDDFVFYVCRGDHENLTDDEIAKLGKGADATDVVYEIDSPKFKSHEEAYSSLVGSTMVTQDKESDDLGIWAVAYGPSMEYLLVIVLEYDGEEDTQVFSAKAIENGVFDAWSGAATIQASSGGTYGATIQEVYRVFSGRDI